MNNYFIYQFTDINIGLITVLFVNQEMIEKVNKLSDEIKFFFENHPISEKLVVILPKYLSEDSKTLFYENLKAEEEIFKRLPYKKSEYFENSYIIFEFDEKGKLNLKKGQIDNINPFVENLLRHGNTHIFIKNGGLVESSEDHHFVFPSKKHCSKFLRTGNILIQNSEILFLSFQLLKFLNDKMEIYCDTSSINSLAYAIFEIKRRFKKKFRSIPVHSFESYEVFENKKIAFPRDSFILVSSSTSGNIIDRLIDKQLAEESQILVLFYLGEKENYEKHKNRILCNITRDKFLLNGSDKFETYKNEEVCNLCNRLNSKPIEIRGDVFLTIKPKVSKVLLSTIEKCVPKYLNDFIKSYRTENNGYEIIKSYFKQSDSDYDYEHYFDTDKLFSNIYKYADFDKKLNWQINKHIPANTKYFVHLEDTSSKLLAEIVRVRSNLSTCPIYSSIDFENKIENNEGAAVIIASCITTGKNLLHISRLMRKFDKLNLIYFIAFLRTPDEKYRKFLIDNLSKGKDGDERPFISIERLICSNKKENTSWKLESKMLRNFIAGDNARNNVLYLYFLESRVNELEDNKKSNGLSRNVFLKKYDSNPLRLERNFAFWNFGYNEDEVLQSEVYFTISSIIKQLENNEINCGYSLKQSNYVRNLIDPQNFNRFNDGIIQASILRACEPSYLAYELDNASSLEICNLLESMIEKFDNIHGEALLEFLLAIGLKKLTMQKHHTKKILNMAVNCSDNIISSFANDIKKKLHLVDDI